jgi:ABC-type antimicrobial peptide transport system permease subunit
MNIFQALKLGFKKIRFNKGKTLFVIVPIALMFAIIVVAASESQNLITVAHMSIFSPIQGQNEVLEITKINRGFMPTDTTTSDAGFTVTDVSNISAVSNVEKASLVSQLPINLMKSSDTFDNKSYSINALAGLDSEYAKLYTNENFEYKEGEPIPIILNANDFVEVYQEWGDKTEVAINFAAQGGDPASISSQSPIKTRSISYNRSDLIGKTITVNFGGLTDIADYKQEPSANGFTFKKKTADEIKTETEARKIAISKYWNYDKISNPLTYTFKIVGISEGTDKTMAYIPSAFASKLITDYISNEITARNGIVMPTEEQNATYTGLVYDGVSIQNDATSTIFANIRNQVRGQVNNQFGSINDQINAQNRQISRANSQIAQQGQSIGENGRPVQVRRQRISGIGTLDANSIAISFPGASTTYNIPGLIYQKDRTSNSITGEAKSFDFTKPLPIVSNKILVKINGLTAREQIVRDINAKGYNFQDFSKYKEFSTLEGYLHLILNIASAVFMVITALFILINMAKFVSESRKEIGIFRAIGASKGDIRIIFILQAFLYILLSLSLGGIIGMIAVFGLSGIMVSSAQQFITTTLGSSITLSENITNMQFINFNLEMIGLYTVILLIVTLIISLIPSEQAARISPVEAIRNS